MDYLDYYELSQEPFSNAPVSRFYYDSAQHSQALIRLKYAVSTMKGLAVLVGSIGAGKTTLARRLLDALDESEYEAALLVIIHSGITSDWLLRRIAVQLGVEDPAQDKLTMLSQLYRRLVEIYEAGKKAVVLIDEAQMLRTRELMEEFRGLLNLEVPERKLLSFVFFGLPDIEDHLRIDLPLAQRIALRVRLDPFDLQSSDAYIRHRLRVAGGAAVDHRQRGDQGRAHLGRRRAAADQHPVRQRALRRVAREDPGDRRGPDAAGRAEPLARGRGEGDRGRLPEPDVPSEPAPDDRSGRAGLAAADAFASGRGARRDRSSAPGARQGELTDRYGFFGTGEGSLPDRRSAPGKRRSLVRTAAGSRGG